MIMKVTGIRSRNNYANTTIAIWKSTKDKLDKNKAPGQCYNGFICQLVDLWERREEEKEYSRVNSTEK
jgi:hypothetical protein